MHSLPTDYADAPPASPEDIGSEVDARSRLARAVSAVLRRETGRGAMRVRADLSPGYAVVFCSGAFSPLERSVSGTVAEDQFAAGRLAFDRALQPLVAAAAQDAVQREVTSVMFAHDLDADQLVVLILFISLRETETNGAGGDGWAGRADRSG